MARIRVNKRKRHTLSARVMRVGWRTLPAKPKKVEQLWKRARRKD